MASAQVTPLFPDVKTDMEHFEYSQPVANKYKSKTSYVTKSKSDPSCPRYQMVGQNEPRLRCPYGISKPFDDTEQEKDRKSLDMTIDSDEMKALFEKLDEQNVQIAHKNSVLWFGRQLPLEQIRFQYQPIVKLDKNGKYKPTFRTKVNCSSADNCTRFFTIREEKGEIKYIQRDSSIITNGCQVVPICEISTLWFNAKSFGMSINCTDVIVFSGGQRAEFPFQWGDSKPVPMDDAEQQDDASKFAAESNSSTQAGQSASTFTSSFVPPAEPYGH